MEHIKNSLVKKVKNYQMQLWKDRFLESFEFLKMLAGNNIYDNTLNNYDPTLRRGLSSTFLSSLHCIIKYVL